jgi:YidC/Oxa1 family membrane protein insertase
MDERRLMLAVALSFLVLLGYRVLYPPQPEAEPAAPATAASVAPPAAIAASPPATPASAAAPEPAVADERERRVEVIGRDSVVAFSNRGARLLSWRLQRFKDARGAPEEMVQTPQDGARPLDLETGDPAVDARLRGALFEPSSETLTLAGEDDAQLRFVFSDGELVAEKTLRFRADGYLLAVSASVRQAGRELPLRLLWGPGLGHPTAAEKEVQGYQAPQGVFLGATGVERVPVGDLAAPRAIADVRWVGVESQYFTALLVPAVPPGRAELRAVSLPPQDGEAERVPLVALELGSAPSPTLLYVGPKDHSALAGLGHDLVAVVPVGEWIGPIVVPLMKLLRFVHSRVGNYGWSIVVLTVLINLAMAPLRHYSIANSLKMAKLAPEMKVIQERYRKVPALDPRRQEMQQEVAALYARHGMSMSTQMLVGCLPLLLTMPFLFAFYRVLQVEIALKGASFLWIPDLSQKDPLFLTPVLMGASMLVMQKMMPTAMDPAQARMMMVMPVVLVVMFFAAPGGLNLYWLASNVCSIVQQGVTLMIIRRGDAPAGTRKDKERRQR